MSVREYIGARYVPIFVGTWDNTQSYEPLSIVQYQGNSYTSRQYVPAGVAIANDAYWAETGNFNAQIEAYRQEVMQYDERISENTVNLEALTGTVSELEADFGDFKTETDRAIDIDKSAIFPAVTDGWFTIYSGRFYEGNGTDILRPFTPAGLAMVGNDLIYSVLVNTVSNNVDIYECNRVSNTVTLYKSNVFMGHCNTMTYSPISNRFYVMPGQSNLGDGDTQFHNVIFVYDRSFGNMQRYTAPGTVGCISFDHATQKLVYANNETGAIYDINESTMEFTRRDVTFPNRNVVHQTIEGSYIFQGGAIYNDFYVVPIGWNGLNDPNLIAVYDLKEGKYLKSYLYPRCTDIFPLGELEDCAFDERGMLYLSGGNPFMLNNNESNQTTIFKSGIFCDMPMGNEEMNVVPQEITVLNSSQYRPNHAGQKFTFKEISEALCYAKYHETTAIRLMRPTTDNNIYWYRCIVNITGMRVAFIAADEYVGIYGRLWLGGNAIVHWNNGLRIKLAHSGAGTYPIRAFDSIFMVDHVHVYPGDTVPTACVYLLNDVMFCVDGQPTLHDLENVPAFQTSRLSGFGYRTTPFTGQ